MKKLLGILVLGLLLSGCSENILSDKRVVLNCISKVGSEYQLVIDLDKNTMEYFEWTYTITSISDTKITANNLDRLLTTDSLRQYLVFKRYGGDFKIQWVYSDGKIHSNYKYNCKKTKKVF